MEPSTTTTTTIKYSDFQLKFFKRIKLEPMVISTIEDISLVLKHCSQVFSFENLDIVTGTSVPLTREILIDQVLCKNQSGLCYKINTLLKDFLVEFGINVYLIRGSVENQETHATWNIPSGHMINILKFNERLYVVDAAFGCNLALSPIPITDNGEIEIESITGIYRIRRTNNIVANKFHYTHILEFRKNDSYLIEAAKQWTLGYAFDPLSPCDDNDQTIVQDLVINDPDKEFSIRPLSFRLLNDGLATLTYHSYTFTKFNGEKSKVSIDTFEQYNQYLDTVFNLPILKKPIENI